MIKVMIADDEYPIREGLKNIVPWDKYGMEVVATAENGEEGLAMAEAYRPDLVVTDICMPFMSGLEMSEQLLREQPDTTLLILTSYDEFQYARKALQLGAADYLLKPVDLEALENILGNLRQRILRKEQRHNSVSAAISGVVHGRQDAARLQESLERAGLPTHRTYCCLLFKLLGFGLAQSVLSADELRDFRRQFGELLDECCGGQQMLLEGQEENGRYLVVLGGESRDAVSQVADRLCRNIRLKEHIRDDYPLLCAISDPMDGEERLITAYRQCKELVQTSFLYDDTQFIHYGSLHHRRDNLEGIPDNMEAFADALRSFDPQAIQKCLEEISASIRSSGRDSLLYGHVFVAAAFTGIIKTAQEVGVESEEFYEELKEGYHRILGMDSFSGQIKGIGELAGKLCRLIECNKDSPHTSTIQRAKKYVDSNYMDSTLTLQRVSSAVHMSPSYFSIIFKQTVGKSFITYLSDLRMERAAYLLRHTSQKVYEIGYAVGYDNPTYFSTLFKKNFGMGPVEYRQQFSGDPSSKNEGFKKI